MVFHILYCWKVLLIVWIKHVKKISSWYNSWLSNGIVIRILSLWYGASFSYIEVSCLRHYWRESGWKISLVLFFLVVASLEFILYFWSCYHIMDLLICSFFLSNCYLCFVFFIIVDCSQRIACLMVASLNYFL